MAKHIVRANEPAHCWCGKRITGAHMLVIHSDGGTPPMPFCSLECVATWATAKPAPEAA